MTRPEPRQPFNNWSYPPDQQRPDQQPSDQQPHTWQPLTWQPPVGNTPAPAGPYPEQQLPYARRTSGYATASLVFGIIGALGGWCMFGVPCLIAVVTGHAALKETRTGKRGGHGMAVAGLILGYPFAVLWILVAILGGGSALFDMLFK
jgi:hypothetical protein